VVKHEQALGADDAIIPTDVSGVPIGAGEGTLTSHRLRNVILEGGQALFNVFLSLLESLFGPFFKAGHAVEGLA
jgi:hypothetical protein